MLYKIDPQRQKIIDSWPDEINDSNAQTDWKWNPDFNFEKAYKDYLIPSVNVKYK